MDKDVKKMNKKIDEKINVSVENAKLSGEMNRNTKIFKGIRSILTATAAVGLMTAVKSDISEIENSHKANQMNNLSNQQTQIYKTINNLNIPALSNEGTIELRQAETKYNELTQQINKLKSEITQNSDRDINETFGQRLGGLVAALLLIMNTYKHVGDIKTFAKERNKLNQILTV
jgi:hypothetical protein